MIDTVSSASSISIVWKYAGPLIGVVLGYLISYKVWNRQRQWEMRRDAVLDALRGLADFENALTELDSTFTVPVENCTERAKTALENMQIGAMQQFGKCRSAYKRAHIVADLAVGGQVSKDLSAYFQFAAPLGRDAISKKRNVLESTSTKKELALRGNAVIMSAREALGIKDAGDLPLLDESD